MQFRLFSKKITQLTLYFSLCLHATLIAEEQPLPSLGIEVGGNIEITTSSTIMEENPEGQIFGYSSPLLEKYAITRHLIPFQEGTLSYSAVVGRLPLTDSKGGEIAQIGFTLYSSKPFDENGKRMDPTRPLLFFFNGGPGCSSAWLHLGLGGPWRIPTIDEPTSQDEVDGLLPNPVTLLDCADLIFVDPVLTGFSRYSPEVNPSTLLGYADDAWAMVQFIGLFQEHFNSWRAPVYLIGESYGAMRAIEVANQRQELGLDTAGLVLISGYIDNNLLDGPLNLPYTFPTMAAIAWKNKKMASHLQKLSLKEVLQRSREFASTQLTLAVLQGGRLPNDQKAAVVKQISDFTGLPPAYITDSAWDDLPFKFPLHLLRSEGKRVGLYDGLLQGKLDDLSDPILVADSYLAYDPSIRKVSHRYTTTIRDYMRRHLNVQFPEKYYVSAGECLSGYRTLWNQQGEFSRASVEQLGNLLRHTPQMRVFFANGYYDLVTPFFANEYQMGQLGRAINAEQVILKNYQGGHMMYLYKDTLIELGQDLRSFLLETPIE